MIVPLFPECRGKSGEKVLPGGECEHDDILREEGSVAKLTIMVD